MQRQKVSDFNKRLQKQIQERYNLKKLATGVQVVSKLQKKPTIKKAGDSGDEKSPNFMRHTTLSQLRHQQPAEHKIRLPRSSLFGMQFGNHALFLQNLQNQQQQNKMMDKATIQKEATIKEEDEKSLQSSLYSMSHQENKGEKKEQSKMLSLISDTGSKMSVSMDKPVQTDSLVTSRQSKPVSHPKHDTPQIEFTSEYEILNQKGEQKTSEKKEHSPNMEAAKQADELTHNTTDASQSQSKRGRRRRPEEPPNPLKALPNVFKSETMRRNLSGTLTPQDQYLKQLVNHHVSIRLKSQSAKMKTIYENRASMRQ